MQQPEEMMNETPVNADHEAMVSEPPFTEVPVAPTTALWAENVCDAIFARCQQYMREGKFIESSVMPTPVVERLRRDGVIVSKHCTGTWSWDIVE